MVRWARHVTYMMRNNERNAYRILVKKSEEDNLGDIGAGGRTILGS